VKTSFFSVNVVSSASDVIWNHCLMTR